MTVAEMRRLLDAFEGRVVEFGTADPDVASALEGHSTSVSARRLRAHLDSAPSEDYEVMWGTFGITQWLPGDQVLTFFLGPHADAPAGPGGTGWLW
jgi:hypothetical protein